MLLVLERAAYTCFNRYPSTAAKLKHFEIGWFHTPSTKSLLWKIIVIKAKKCPVWEIYQEFVELIITLWHSPTWWFLDKNRLATQPDPNGSFQCLCLSSVVWQWVTAVCHQCSGTWQLTRAAIYMAAAEGVAFISCDSVNTLPVHAAIAITVCKLDS